MRKPLSEKKISGFRPVRGLINQSSTLWMTACFIVLLFWENIQNKIMVLTKEEFMKKTTRLIRIGSCNVLKTVWTIGASVLAVSLSA